jgi:hypothetical protein
MAAAAKAQAAKTEAAAAASGVAKTEIAVAAEAAAGGAGEGATQTTQAAAAGAGAAGDGKGGEGAEAAAGAVAPAAAATAPDLSALVAKVTDLSIANVKLEAERDSYLASCAAMITVVSDSLDRMSIALGGGKIDVSKMTPETLVAQHTATAATFAAKFPIGGVAAVPAGAEVNQEAQDAKKHDLFLHNQRVAAAAGSFAVKK